MKLTNLSLSILVALGLIACGGSDDNSNAAADNNNAGHQQGGKGGSGGVPEEKKPEQTNEDKKNEQTSGIDPTRVAPDLKVPADLSAIVNSRKKSFIDRSFSDKALGYNDNGDKYQKKFDTDPGDIKYGSMYNFSDEDDLISKASGNYTVDAIGAIFVGDDPQANNLNAWVKGPKGEYFRVRANANAANYKPSTQFSVIDAIDFGSGATTIDQDKIVFIANATLDSTVNKIDLTVPSNFELKRSEVVLNTVSALGENYSASSTGQELDFSKLPVKAEIQEVPVTGQYSIINTKDNAKSIDDKGLTRDIKLGHIKAYNLPYSIAFVTVNESKNNDKNIFAFPDATATTKNNTTVTLNSGAYQVNGLQTVSLPKQGRAFYTGKSFNATVEGDVQLIADFFDDRAGVTGTVLNRKDLEKGKSLPEVTLHRAELTDLHSGHSTNSSAPATGDAKIQNWTVQFYGLDAQEASGFLRGKDYTEVFATQRGALSNHSNTPDTKK